jgi:hypothetical protein
MWSPLLAELLAEERQSEMIQRAEYTRMVSAVCDQAGPWRSTRRLMLRAIGYSRARIAGGVEEQTARTEQVGVPGELC